MYTCVCWNGWRRAAAGRMTAALRPSLVSSSGNMQTSRGRQKQLDHDLSSGALRQIKGRRVMRGDQETFQSAPKAASTPHTANAPGPIRWPLCWRGIVRMKLGFHVIQREAQMHLPAPKRKRGRLNSPHGPLNFGASCFHFKAAQLPRGNSDGKTPHNRASRKSSQWSRLGLITRNICCSPPSIIVHLSASTHYRLNKEFSQRSEWKGTCGKSSFSAVF